MYEYKYKSEVFKASAKFGEVKKGTTRGKDLDKLDELINQQAAEGWELAFQSIALDATLAQHKILLTFRKPKD